MVTRSIFWLVKCNPCARRAIFHRLLTTDRAGFSAAINSNAARKLSYEVNFGAHCRAPHDKATCEDAFFFWNRNGVAAFGRFTTKG